MWRGGKKKIALDAFIIITASFPNLPRSGTAGQDHTGCQIGFFYKL